MIREDFKSCVLNGQLPLNFIDSKEWEEYKAKRGYHTATLAMTGKMLDNIRFIVVPLYDKMRNRNIRSTERKLRYELRTGAGNP